MFSILWNIEQGLHHFFGSIHTIHCFEQWNNIKSDFFLVPTAPSEQSKYEQYGKNIFRITNNVAVTSIFTVFVLDCFQILNIDNGIFYDVIIKILWIEFKVFLK